MKTLYQKQWKVVGKAGEGEMVSSKLMAKLYKRLGMSVFAYYEYPSLIKGGHQTGQVVATSEQQEFVCQTQLVDVLVALAPAALSGHESEVNTQSIVVVNQAATVATTQFQTARTYALPLTELAKTHAGSPLATNIVLLGVSAWCLQLPKTEFLNLLIAEFADKGEAVVANNQAAFTAGWQAAQAAQLPQFPAPPSQLDTALLLTGNEAIGLGALAGGLQFYAAYPMTPASGLMHYLAQLQADYPIVVKHAEDEIAAINQAVGASFAGVRAMTGSAGGGFALMVETVSLLGVMELPLVIMVGQRPGPATGLPTWTTQADLQFVLHAGHGEFPRIVLTPGSVTEHFTLARQAMDLAELYQIPVFILTDKYLLESQQTMTRPEVEFTITRQSLATAKELAPDDSYRRYALTDSGISPRSLPGQAHGLHMANSYEHDVYGFATEEAALTQQQVEKRAKKLDGFVDQLPSPRLIGVAKAPVRLVSWGSTITVTAAVALASNGQVAAIHVPCVWPFPTTQLQELLAGAQEVIVVEGNQTGQFEQLLRQETSLTVTNHLRRYDGRPFMVEEVIDWLQQQKLYKSESKT